MRRSAITTLLLGLSLAGCQTAPPAAPAPPRGSVTIEEVEAWRQLATPAGQAAIDGLDGRWTLALADARRRGAARTIAAEAPLLDPSGALPRAAPAPGPYRCRLVRLAAPGARIRGIAVSRPAFCYVGVEGDQLSFTSEIPAQRFGGYLHETRTSTRLIFLGSAAPARGQAVAGYGEDAARDRVGRFERVDEFRYRLLIPSAAAPELLVYELVAAPRE